MSTAGGDLLFEQLATTSGDLVFGEFSVAVSTISGTISLDDSPTLQAVAIKVGLISGEVELDDPAFVGTAEYLSQTARPLVATVRAPFEQAVPVPTGIETGFSATERMHAGIEARHTLASPQQTPVASAWRNGQRTRAGAQARYTEADRVQSDMRRVVWQDSIRTRAGTTTSWRNGQRRQTTTTDAWQDRNRDRRPSLSVPWAEAKRSGRAVVGRSNQGTPLEVGRVVPWGEAMRPPAGMWVPPTPPGPDPCYVPDPHLVFEARWTGSPHLVFICERHPITPPNPPALVVVPVRRVYIVQNNAFLRRADTGEVVPSFSFSLSLDVDSWAWGFRASVPMEAQSLVTPSTPGQPVLLEAVINGTTVVLLAERISRDRAFSGPTLSISGRSKTALLDKPYAPSPAFFNNSSGDRTAAQLADDVLTLNGVPIGWSVDWQLTDWLVPAGAWSHSGTYISALSAIASAAGGYVQPHDTDDAVRILHRYPAAPWDWGSVSPDIELPVAVTSRESLEWIDKPIYDRVFVEGQQGGIRGQVTRTGFAGDQIAQGVVDSLITHADAARQRGRAILSDTGSQINVGLKLPVLSSTNIIRPGHFVRYVDGSDVRLGLVRSTDVAVSFPEVWQTIGVQTHVI